MMSKTNFETGVFPSGTLGNPRGTQPLLGK